MNGNYFALAILFLLVSCAGQQGTLPISETRQPMYDTTPSTPQSGFPDDIITEQEATELEMNTKNSEACQSLVWKTAVVEGQIVNKNYFRDSGDQEVGTYLGIKTTDGCIFYFLKKSTFPGGTREYNDELSKTIGDHIKVKGFVKPKQHYPNSEVISFYELGSIQEVGPDFSMEPQKMKCIHEPECPAGKELVITETYTGGSQYGCPYKWECQ